MKLTDLVYVGIKGTVIALNRATGQQVWSTHLKGSAFVNVVAHDGKVYASTYGEIYCLDAMTGSGLWHNELSGMGWGLSTMAMIDMPACTGVPPVIQERIREQQASSSSTQSTTTTNT